MVKNKEEKALRIYLVIFFLSIVILSTAQFVKSKTVQRVERAMKNNDSSNLNHKGIKEVNKVKKVKKILKKDTHINLMVLMDVGHGVKIK